MKVLCSDKTGTLTTAQMTVYYDETAKASEHAREREGVGRSGGLRPGSRRRPGSRPVETARRFRTVEDRRFSRGMSGMDGPKEEPDQRWMGMLERCAGKRC